MAAVDVDIPSEYKAIVYDEPGKISTSVDTLKIPEPGPGEVLIHLTHSGVCHSDLGVMENSVNLSQGFPYSQGAPTSSTNAEIQWATLPYPTPKGQVGGHEGVGTVVKMGPATERATVKVGQRVGIKWVAGICGSCPPCLSGHDALCHQGKISGYYT
ncbi:MAG: hypothetical protein Q9222_001785 [Ikaeria aurantiellina]